MVEHRHHTRLVVHLRILLAAEVVHLVDTAEEVEPHSLAALVVGTVLVLVEPVVRKELVMYVSKCYVRNL